MMASRHISRSSSSNSMALVVNSRATNGIATRRTDTDDAGSMDQKAVSVIQATNKSHTAVGGVGTLRRRCTKIWYTPTPRTTAPRSELRVSNGLGSGTGSRTTLAIGRVPAYSGKMMRCGRRNIRFLTGPARWRSTRPGRDAATERSLSPATMNTILSSWMRRGSAPAGFVTTLQWWWRSSWSVPSRRAPT